MYMCTTIAVYHQMLTGKPWLGLCLHYCIIYHCGTFSGVKRGEWTSGCAVLWWTWQVCTMLAVLHTLELWVKTAPCFYVKKHCILLTNAWKQGFWLDIENPSHCMVESFIWNTGCVALENNFIVFMHALKNYSKYDAISDSKRDLKTITGYSHYNAIYNTWQVVTMYTQHVVCRAWVSLNQVYLLSKESPHPMKARKAGFEKSMKELSTYIFKLRYDRVLENAYIHTDLL